MEKLIKQNFTEIKKIIQQANYNALYAVNSELICLYWTVGEYISHQIDSANWGEKVVAQLAGFLKMEEPDLKGFDKRSLFRMKQFFETYRNAQLVATPTPLLENDNSEIVATLSPQFQKTNIRNSLLTKISWSHHIEILNKAKTLEEKEFYILLTIQEKYSVRDLRRQIESSYFERTILANKTLPLLQPQVPQNLTNVFKDSYIFEFLKLPEPHSEDDLQKALLQNLKKFLLELGGGFTFVGENVRIQVGMKNFYVDLLFFHRDLQCLVLFELKTTDFEPSFLGQVNFYLEALDRDFRKPHENPSIGVLLCKSKDTEVIEYALSRNLSPTLVAEYNTKFIDKALLKDKFHELLNLLDIK